MNNSARKELIEYESEGTKVLRDFLSQPADTVLKRVQAMLVEGSPHPFPDDTYWHTLAIAVETRAIPGSKDDLIWAEITIMLYEHLAEIMPEHRLTMLRHAMLKRRDMIIQYGYLQGDAIRDTQILKDWFLNNIDIEIDRIKHIVTGNKIYDLDAQSKHSITNILERLEPLMLLQKAGLFQADSTISDWFEVETAFNRLFWKGA